MVEQLGILVGGQSQGNNISERSKFEDQMPETAVRNPAVFERASIVSRSHQQDSFSLPGVWPTKYQNFRLRGRATSAVRRLTPYNPTASYYEMQDVANGAYGGHVGVTYPGQAAHILNGANLDRTRLFLRCAFQADPVGLSVTRRSTGTTHTIAAGWVNTSPGLIDLADAADEAIGDGEVFDLPLQCRAAGTTTTIPSNVRFGGYSDGGSLFEAAYGGGATAVLGGYTVQPYPIDSFPAVSAASPVSIEVKTRHFRPGMRVQFVHTAGTHPDLAAGTDFWVVRTNYGTADSPRIYVSTSRNGPEVVYGGVAPTGTSEIATLPQHVESTMAGCRVRFTSGNLNGQAFDLTDNVLSAAAPTDNFDLQTIETMPSAPQLGDTFVIEPQQINGEDVDWDQFEHFVPECTMAGQPHGQLISLSVTYPNTSSGQAVTFTGAAYEGMRLRFYDYFNLATATTTPAPTSGSFTGAGQLLFAVNVNYAANTFQVSTTYNGSPINDAALTASNVAYFVDEHPDRGNPMPPGFNDDNTRAVPGVYQPYFGALPSITVTDPGATFTTSLALALHQKVGRPIHVIHTNVGGTCVGRREATPTVTFGSSHAWFDSNVMLDWSPNGEVDNCYARMVKRLENAKRAAAANGDTLKIIGVFFPQGESDVAFLNMLARYPENLRTLIAAVRAKIVELGMWDGPAETIPWWQPNVPTTTGGDWGNDNYVSNIALNDIFNALAVEDPFFVTRALEDATVGYDSIHYSGEFLWTFGQHAFNDWLTIAQDPDDRTRVDICNQALKNIGETRIIESLTEDTTAAKLCNRYYPIVLRLLLEEFPWKFATKTTPLVATTNTRSDLDWQYAYTLPVNFLGVVGLGPDSGGAYVAEETEYDIEGRVLYCNLSSLTLRYTTVSPDPADYSQHFTNAFSHRLAAEIAPGLAQGDKGAALAQSQLQLASYHVGLAKEHTALRQRHANHADENYAWD